MRRVALVALAFLSPCFGQRTSQPVTSPLIDRTKPTVYLTYQRSERLTPKATHAATDVIWLELRNNTRWRIIKAILPNPSGNSDWCYEVVTDDNCRTHLYPNIGNCSGFYGFQVVEPGQSISAAVPAGDLSRGLAIETKFSFEWEPDSRVRHSVWLGHSDLPSQVKQTIATLVGVPLPRNECNAASDLTPLPDPQSMTPVLRQILHPLSGAAMSSGPPKDAPPKRKEE